MAKAKLDVKWLNVNASDVPKSCKTMYDQLAKAAATVKDTRGKLEEGMIAAARKQKTITADQTLVFFWRFGLDPFRVAIADTADVGKRGEAAAGASSGAALFG